MPAAAAIILFGLFVAVVYLIIRPFIEPPEPDTAEIVTPELESQKNRIIDAIREIDMDYQTGKLSEEDYSLLRSRYTAAAAEVLRRIDREAAEAEREEAGGRVEVPSSVDDASFDEDVERQIAQRKTAIEAAACPECGADRRPGDAFCGKCGTTLLESEEA